MMTAWQEIVTQPAIQPNRLKLESAVCPTPFPMAKNHAADMVKAETVGNETVIDHRANLALVTAYLIAATNRNYAPLHALKHTIGIRNSIGTSDTVRTAGGKVRPHLERLTRLRQIRLYAMGWKQLLRSNQEHDPRIAQAFFTSAELLKEVMKPS